jgi:hypothetical protein
MGKKIVISESQYRRVFLNEQDDKLVVKPTDALSVTSLVPNTKVDTCKPKGVLGGIPGMNGTNWCDVMSKGKQSCYMGICTVTYKGIKYQFNQSSSISDTSYNKSSGEVLSADDSAIVSYIVNWNKVLSRRNELKGNAVWSDSVEIIDDKWLKKYSGDIQSRFNREKLGNNGSQFIGVGSTTIYNPGWLIQKYFEIRDNIYFNLQTIIKDEQFKANVREVEKRFQMELSKWEEKMEVWENYFGEKSRNIDNQILSTQQEIEKQDQWRDMSGFELYKPEIINFKKITPIEYDGNNPNEISYTKKDEKESYLKYDYIPKVKPDNVKHFQDWLDSKNLMWVNGNNLNKGPGYGNFGKFTERYWKMYSYVYDYEINPPSNRSSIPSMPPKPEKPKILSMKREDTAYISELEATKVSIEVLLSAVDSFNNILLTQNKNNINKFCRNINGKRNVPGGGSPYGAIPINKGTKDFRYMWYIEDVCPNKINGGAWVYSQGKNSKVCGCVRTPKGQQLYDSGTFKFDELLTKRLENTDIRSGFEKLTDWSTGCMDDWHCLADIASIAVLFLPIPGLNFAASAALRTGASALIDLTSAVGYAVEGEEGWELNAGLTILGTAFSGIESLKYSRMAINGDKAITKLSKNLDNALEKADKLTKDADWGKLSKVEQSAKYSEEIRKGLKNLNSKELEQLSNIITAFNKDSDQLVKELKSVLDDLSSLSKDEKIGLREVIKKMNKDKTFAKKVGGMYLMGGKDSLIQLIKQNAPKLVKDAAIQSTLFALLNLYSEEVGKKILSGLEKFKELTGIDVIAKLKNKDKDTEDQETKDIEELIKTFEVYEKYALIVLNYIDSPTQKDIKEKYGVDLYSLKEKIFSSEDPLFPDQLRDLSGMIGEFLDEVTNVENENIEDSKSYVQGLFDVLVSFIESDQKSEGNIKKLYDIYKNNPCVDCDLKIDNYEDFRELEKTLELMDNI